MILKNKLFQKTIVAACSVFIMNSLAFASVNVEAAEMNNKTYASLEKELTSNITYSVKGNAKVGNTIEIHINASNVSNLFGASLDFLYDPNLIEVESVQTGTLFNGRIQKPVVNRIINGKASLAVSLVNETTPAIEGNGSIAIIKAKVLKKGKLKLKTTDNFSELSLDKATTCIKLSTSQGQKIKYKFKDKTIKLSKASKK